MSGFNVMEDQKDFMVEVICDRKDYPEEFTVSGIIKMLKSLPWPESFSTNKSEPPRFTKLLSKKLKLFTQYWVFLQPHMAYCIKPYSCTDE